MVLYLWLFDEQRWFTHHGPKKSPPGAGREHRQDYVSGGWSSRGAEGQKEERDPKRGAAGGQHLTCCCSCCSWGPVWTVLSEELGRVCVCALAWVEWGPETVDFFVLHNEGRALSLEVRRVG